MVQVAPQTGKDVQLLDLVTSGKQNTSRLSKALLDLNLAAQLSGCFVKYQNTIVIGHDRVPIVANCHSLCLCAARQFDLVGQGGGSVR